MAEDPFKPMMKFEEPKESKPPDRPLPDISSIVGLIKTRTTVPTGVPKKFSEQMVIVIAGGANSLYIYDPSSNLWRSTTLIST